MDTNVIELLKDKMLVSLIGTTGPDGQNVNMAAPSIHPRINFHNSPSLDTALKALLVHPAGRLVSITKKISGDVNCIRRFKPDKWIDRVYKPENLR